MQKTITVTGIESTDQKITILFNKEKYTIWIKDKKTGQDSQPYQQFQKIRPIAGDNLEVEVWEAPDTFVNPKGEIINYTKRYINKFILDGEGNPSISQHSAPQSTQMPQVAQVPKSNEIEALSSKIAVSFKQRDAKIAELADMVIEMQGQLSYFSTMFKESNPDAHLLHEKELPPTENKEKFEFPVNDYAKIPLVGAEETKKFEDDASKKLFG